MINKVSLITGCKFRNDEGNLSENQDGVGDTTMKLDIASLLPYLATDYRDRVQQVQSDIFVSRCIVHDISQPAIQSSNKLRTRTTSQVGSEPNTLGPRAKKQSMFYSFLKLPTQAIDMITGEVPFPEVPFSCQC